jgi:DNA-directed RNA polymerase alpha subunit
MVTDGQYLDALLTVRKYLAQIKNEINEAENDVTRYFNPALEKKIVDLDISTRLYNVLRCHQVKTLGDLARYKANDVLRFRNMGSRSFSEVKLLLKTNGLKFDMFK